MPVRGQVRGAQARAPCYPASTRGWYVAPDGVHCPTVPDPENMQIFTIDEFSDVCAVVLTLRDATPCLRGTRHAVLRLLCVAMAHCTKLTVMTGWMQNAHRQ